MKAIAWIIGLATMAAAGVYTAVSLGRWEWSRALFFGLVFVAAELGVIGATLFNRLNAVELAVRSGGPGMTQPIDAVRAAREDHERFPWLRPDPAEVLGRTNVFVTMLVGGGVLLAAGAWVVDQVASRTVDPVREAKLGHQLDAVAYPDGLVVDEIVAVARTRPDQDDPRLSSFLGDP